MRRREKFVLASILLSLGLLGLQYVSLDWRYLGVLALMLVTYIFSAWALSDDLQRFELLTIVPLPALYAGAVGVFYFLLPDSLVTRLGIISLFGVGMYALYLTGNIYSVSKGRTIQLVHAAQAIGLFFTIFMSLLYTNTIFSLKLPFYLNALLVGGINFPLMFLFLWSVNLEPRVDSQLIRLTGLLTVILAELAAILSFFPFSAWNMALITMSAVYMGAMILQNYLKSRLFQSTLQEFSVLAVMTLLAFLYFLPWK